MIKIKNNIKIKIITNGYYKTEASIYQAERLLEECRLLHFDAEIIENNRDLREIDCEYIIFLDKDINLALYLEKRGIKVCNCSRAIEICDNKIRTLTQLKGVVEIPEYILYPFQYFFELDLAFIQYVEDKLEYPFVIKEAYSSLGLGVYLINNRAECLNIIEKISDKQFYFQKFVSKNSGQSYRIYAVKNKILKIMKLENAKSFKSNASVGGIGKEVHLDKVFENKTLEIMEKLNLDFGGLDFFVDEKPIIIEVNSNAYFKELEKVNNEYNIAKQIVLSCIKKEIE